LPEGDALKLAQAHPKAAPFLAGKPIKRVIYVPEKSSMSLCQSEE